MEIPRSAIFAQSRKDLGRIAMTPVLWPLESMIDRSQANLGFLRHRKHSENGGIGGCHIDWHVSKQPATLSLYQIPDFSRPNSGRLYRGDLKSEFRSRTGFWPVFERRDIPTTRPGSVLHLYACWTFLQAFSTVTSKSIWTVVEGRSNSWAMARQVSYER